MSELRKSRSETDPVVSRDEADDVSRNSAAEAVEESLRRRENERRRLLLVEGTKSNESAPFLQYLDATLSDELAKVVRLLDAFDSLFRNLHVSPPHEWLRMPGPSTA